ncbi:RTA1 like protein-domain-containing protein [Aspergillus foveolatus]|uniref:RTA1 like protein-domain-containing protein n=1 Tax=Aspergillus foveolatus TaxID=210207 RepID=UPI003CCD8B8B
MDSADSSQEVYFALYRYTPSIPAAAVFVAVFVALAVFHGVFLVRHRALFFIPFIVGLFFEAAGYAARIFSHYDTLALGPYIVQTMLILVAPPLFAASIYMTLGRLILRLEAEWASMIRVKYITKIFVIGDVVSFLLQCGGGGYMAAGSLSAMENGERIVIAGLAVQLVFFGFFMFFSAVFHYRVRSDPQHSVRPITADTRFSSSWEAMMWCLYGACILIFIRSVFRVVEFVQGNDGYIMKREYLLYVFDAVLMALQAALLLLAYPGAIVKGSRRTGDCDEAKPICGACALRGEPCGFPPDTSRQPRRERDDAPGGATSRQAQTGPPSVSNARSPHALEFDLSPAPSNVAAEANSQSMNMVDLQLLSYFMIHTGKNMSLIPSRQKVWQTVIPRLAARHEFLMHLLLALAGLDYFHPDGNPDADLPMGSASGTDNSTSMGVEYHLQLVVRHHQCGLQGFRNQLSALSDSNCHEIFAGSLLLVGFAFASLRMRNWNDSHTSPLQPLRKPRLDWIYLIRGLTAVVEQCWPSLRMGPLREMLQYPGATEDWKMYPEAMSTTFIPRGCSPRISRFCQGAYRALSRLHALEGSTPSSTAEDSPETRPSGLKDGLDLVESVYMRILYLAQFSRDEKCTSVEIQADMEDAAVMGWPQALSEEFLATLGDPDVAPNLSLVILAYLYLALALFEAAWFLNGAFDEDIQKIYALCKSYGDRTLISLMEWPVSVIND